MAFPRPNHLTLEDLEKLLEALQQDAFITVERVRGHNKGEIRRSEQMRVADLKDQLLRAYYEEDLGCDWEIKIEKISKTLVAHHDGVFWLE